MDWGGGGSWLGGYVGGHRPLSAEKLRGKYSGGGSQQVRAPHAPIHGAAMPLMTAAAIVRLWEPPEGWLG